MTEVWMRTTRVSEPVGALRQPRADKQQIAVHRDASAERKGCSAHTGAGSDGVELESGEPVKVASGEEGAGYGRCCPLSLTLTAHRRLPTCICHSLPEGAL